MSTLRRKILQAHFNPTRTARHATAGRKIVADLYRKKRAKLGSKKTRDYIIRKQTGTQK